MKIFCVEKFQKIRKYLLCLESMYSSTIKTVQKLGDDQDEDIDNEYEAEGNDAGVGENLHLDFFRFTTRKRYIWEDWTVRTRDPVDYGDNSSSTNFALYVILPILLVGIVGTLLYYCIKNMSDNNCYSSEYNSHRSLSADRFTTVHRPPERRASGYVQLHWQYADSRRELFSEPARADLFSELDINGNAAYETRATTSFVDSPFASSTQGRREPDNTVTNGLPTGRNQYDADSRRRLFGEPARTDLLSELHSNGGAPYATGATFSFVDSPFARSTQDTREPDNTVAENPPDYSMVTLSDRANPTKPYFPVVKLDIETPPPEYGKDNLIFYFHE